MMETGTDEATPDTRIDQKELLRSLDLQLFEDATEFKEVFGFCRVLNVRQSTSTAGHKKSAESDRRVEEVLRERQLVKFGLSPNLGGGAKHNR